MSHGNSQTAGPLVEPLTRRERDILALLAQGNTAPEIAEKLSLAVSSVKWYLQQLYGKLGVNRKQEAIARARELGLVPNPAATGASATATVEIAPDLAPPQRKHNLPVPVTRFFGREHEIAQLAQRLREHRLVTLTGSGGVGKTRLSLRVAEEVRADFPDGVWLVELAALADPALVVQHVAVVLGVRENPARSMREGLTLALHAQQVLLVLDNCEHLLEACAQLAELLLQACPGLKVLASSREPLNISGEAVYGVRSLPFPDPHHLPPLENLLDYTAVRLFVDRARLVRPEYDVSDHNAVALARICQRLDGIPLAIEMAAARVNVLNAANLAERLDDAFRVLTGGSRTALPRQQTLRAMIDWSYELLSQPERRLLQRLSVFAGGCNLEAAEAVCADTIPATPPEPQSSQPSAAAGIDPADILDLLASLVSKSVVIAERRPGEATRYHLLETVRQYAREKLQAAGETERLHARHLAFFIQLAQEAGPELRGPDQIAWLNRLEADLDNFRAALDYSRTGRPGEGSQAGLRLVVDLQPLWRIRGHRREIGAWLEAALAEGGFPERNLARAQALHMATEMVVDVTDVAQVQSKAAESVEIFREAGVAGRLGLAYALITLAQLSHLQGEFAPKLIMLRESVALFRHLGDKWGLALSLHALAATLDPLVNYQPRGTAGSPAPLPELEPAARNDHTTERALFEESLSLFRELGDRWTQGLCLGSLAHMYFCWGQRAAGRASIEEVLAIEREIGEREGIANGLIFLARDALAHDEWGQAIRLCQESAAIRRSAHNDEADPLALFLEAEIARRQGDYELALNRLAEVIRWSQAVGNRDLVAAGLDGQARTARSQGNTMRANALHREALTMRRQAGHPISLAYSFHALALLAAAHAEQSERAARLLGAAEPYHAALYEYWAGLPIWRAEHEAGIAAAQAALGEARFKQLFDEGQALSLQQAYDCALGS